MCVWHVGRVSGLGSWGQRFEPSMCCLLFFKHGTSNVRLCLSSFSGGFTPYLHNGCSVNLRAIENCIFNICSVEYNMRPILRTVYDSVHFSQTLFPDSGWTKNVIETSRNCHHFAEPIDSCCASSSTLLLGSFSKNAPSNKSNKYVYMYTLCGGVGTDFNKDKQLCGNNCT